MGLVVVVGRHWLATVKQPRTAQGRPSFGALSWRPHRDAAPLNLSQRQSATMAGIADRPRTRASRCTPTGLRYAANAVGQSKPRRRLAHHDEA